MTRYALPLALSLVVPALLAAMAQERDELPPPEKTEVWEPEPAVVDPGGHGKAPSDAIVLFDGKDLSKWTGRDGKAEWTVADGAMTVVPGSGSISTRDSFGDVQLHVEWRTPAEIVGESQGRGNSGVFLMERYEVQVLDSFENRTYSNGQAGSIYKQHIPLVNASRAPGEWQTYDIVFMAPRFRSDGSLERPATMTVLHNGVLVQNHVEIKGPTVFRGQPRYEAHAEGADPASGSPQLRQLPQHLGPGAVAPPGPVARTVTPIIRRRYPCVPAPCSPP